MVNGILRHHLRWIIGLLLTLVAIGCADVDRRNQPVDPAFAEDFEHRSFQSHLEGGEGEDAEGPGSWDE